MIKFTAKMDFKDKVIIQHQGGESEKALQYSASSSYPQTLGIFQRFRPFSPSILKNWEFLAIAFQNVMPTDKSIGNYNTFIWFCTTLGHRCEEMVQKSLSDCWLTI